MNSAQRKIETFISEDNLKSFTETFLRANGFVHDHEDVINWKVDYNKKKDGVFPMTYTIKNKNERMQVVEGHV